MKIVFFGSDDFAVRHLEELVSSSFNVVAAVTQPDRAKGRGMKVIESPVKTAALSHQIPCLTPESFNKDVEIELQSFKADIFIVVAYGRILPQRILELPQRFCVNVHGSLLPKYRGAAPINFAIIDGLTQTGVTVMRMNERMDAGDIILQANLPIAVDIKASVLRQNMADLGAKTLITALHEIESGHAQFQIQEESQATYCQKLTRDIGEIDWGLSADELYNRLRGLDPWPGIYTFLNGKRLKILEAKAGSEVGQPGQILSVDKNRIVVGCSKGALHIIKVHPESSKPMNIASFLAGHSVSAGEQLGG